MARVKFVVVLYKGSKDINATVMQEIRLTNYFLCFTVSVKKALFEIEAMMILKEDQDLQTSVLSFSALEQIYPVVASTCGSIAHQSVPLQPKKVTRDSTMDTWAH